MGFFPLWQRKNIEQGRTEEARSEILEQLQEKFGALPEPARQRIEAMLAYRRSAATTSAPHPRKLAPRDGTRWSREMTPQENVMEFITSWQQKGIEKGRAQEALNSRREVLVALLTYGLAHCPKP